MSLSREACSEMESIIECIVCLEVPRNVHIYHCENGHNVCRACKRRVLRCPSGNCRYVGNSRNLTAEHLRATFFKFHCKYQINGCQVLMKENKLIGHEVDCPFRMVECQGCGSKMIMKEFQKHLQVLHTSCNYEERGCQFMCSVDAKVWQNHVSQCPFRIVPCPRRHCKQVLSENQLVTHFKDAHFANEIRFDQTNSSSVTFYCKENMKKIFEHKCFYTFENHFFLLRLKISGLGQFCAWIQILGPKSQAAKFRSHIKVEKDGCKFEMVNRKVYPIDLRATEVMNDEGCFSLSETQAKQFMDVECRDHMKKGGFAFKIIVKYHIKLVK